MSFNNFNLMPSLISAIKDLNFDQPTEIQTQTIPLLLGHTGDFVGQAQTGTGKTVAFVLPLLQLIDDKSRDIQALILTPTRELAQQVNEEVEKLAKYSKIKTAVIFGGVSYTKQIRELRYDKPNLVVGTPGRILDLMDKGILDFKNTKKLVIDEADEMLNMGFLEDVQRIMESLDNKRNIWLFSATVPRPIQIMIQRNFSRIEEVKIKNKTLSNDSIDQYYCVLQKKHFIEGLKRIISAEKDPYGIIFCETKVETKMLAEELADSGFSVATLHGDLSQYDRDQSMLKFRSKRAKILVCTDVAARGIDVKDVGHVFNFGLPRNPEAYVHRIGRTGRAGTKGISISFITPAQSSFIRRIESMIRCKISPLKLPDLHLIKTKKIESEIEKLKALKESILTKGDEFKIDKTFDVFKDFLKELDRDQALKLIFTMKFNKEFQKLNLLGDLEATELRSDRYRPSFRERQARDSRGPSRSSQQSRPRRVRSRRPKV